MTQWSSNSYNNAKDPECYAREQVKLEDILSDFKTDNKSIVIETLYYWHKDGKKKDLWNITENLKINTYIYGELILCKNSNIFLGKE